MGKAINRDGLKIRGFSRVQITENGKIVGDSGLSGPNQVVNLGFQDYLCNLLAGTTGSKQIGFIALGTGTVPGAAATTLNGEISGQRKAPTVAVVSSKTLRFTATFGSTDSFLGGASNLSNIGLFNLTTSNATLFAGNTYASSSCDTNQDVNVTYEIQLS